MMNSSRRTRGALTQLEKEISNPKVSNSPKWSGSEAFSLVSQESSGEMTTWFESGKCRRMVSDILSTESGADCEGNTGALENGSDQAVTRGESTRDEVPFMNSKPVAEVEKEAVPLGVNRKGGSLEDALQRMRERQTALDRSSVAQIALQVCSDMLQLHKEDIAWGAVQPSHVALSHRVDDNGAFPRAGQARISEFCSLKSGASIEEGDDVASAWRYLAPEALRLPELTESWERKAADVFSFGLLLCEMVTSKRPFLRANALRPHWPTTGDADFGGTNCAFRGLADQCCAQDPRSRPPVQLLHQRLSALARDYTENSSEPSQHCPSELRSTLLPDSVPMQKVLSASGVSSYLPVAPERATAQLPTSRKVAFTTVTEGECLTDCSSDSTSQSGHDPHASPLTSPEQWSSKLRDGATAASMSADDLVHTRSASLSNVHRVQVGLDAIQSGSVEHSLQRAESSRSKHSAGTPLVEVATALYDESAYSAHAEQPQPHVLPACAVGSEDPVHVHIKSSSAQSDHDHAEAAVCPTDDQNALDERRVSRDQVAEPESFSTTITAQIIESAPGEYPTSSMSSTSLRRKSSKLKDILAESRPVMVAEENAQSEKNEEPPPVDRSEPYASRPAIKDGREQEKQALDIIGACIAEGNYSTVLSTLKAHRKSHAVAVVSCTFLESICRDESLYFNFCEEGGIEEFISAVLLFGKIDTSLCTVVLNAISALSTHRDDRVSHRLRGMGVPSAVIDMLSYYRTDIGVQSAGCECLALMARSSKQSQTAIATLGGPGVVYRIITQNNSSFRDVELARASLKAVRYIAEKNERAAEYLVEVAALDPVSSIAELFTDDGLEQDILDALEAFSFYTNGRRSIIMSSGMSALSTIMLRNREPRFLVQCCNFIRAVARWNDPECEDAVLQSGIAERVVSLMEMSNNIVGVEGARLGWYACYACTFLASFGSKSKQRLRRVGGVERTIDVFRRRMEDPKVVHIATDALAELMKNEPEARELAMNCNVVGCLKEALIMHKEWSRVMKALQWTLEFLAAPEGALFGPAYGPKSHNDMMRENSRRTHSSRERQKSPPWKSAFGFIRTARKKSQG